MMMCDYWKAMGLSDYKELVSSWGIVQYALCEMESAIEALDVDEQRASGDRFPEVNTAQAIHHLRKAITAVCEELGIVESYMYPPDDVGGDERVSRCSLAGAREYAGKRMLADYEEIVKNKEAD